MHCSLGPYGASFLPELCKPEDAILYCTRPGLRLWKAHVTGSVAATYIYKDLIKKSTNEIAVLADTIPTDIEACVDKQFGPVVFYSESKFILTWSGTSIFVLDPFNGTIVGHHGNVGQIISIGTCDDEIYILRKGNVRPLIRIAQQPDVGLSLGKFF